MRAIHWLRSEKCESRRSTFKRMNIASADSKLTRVSLEIEDAIARIILRNPPLNVIDIPMIEEFAQVLVRIDSEPRVTAMVVSGEGKAFSAGVDIAAHTPDRV